jgi:hypothetical protein
MTYENRKKTRNIPLKVYIRCVYGLHSKIILFLFVRLRVLASHV